jgi:hypothetical protein
MDELSFPDPRWNDSVVVILIWWCDALLTLMKGETGPIAVRFMEGPYLVELGPLSGSNLHLNLVTAGLEPRSSAEADVEIAPLVQSVLSSSERTLVECKRQNWWSEDADDLESLSAKVRREFYRAMD